VIVLKSNFEIAKSSPLTLTLTLNNSQPIELTSFLSAFSSIAQEYQNSISGNPNFESNPEIFVREIRSGSMIADLVPVIVSTAPIIANNAEQLWVTLKFVEKWKARISDLATELCQLEFPSLNLLVSQEPLKQSREIPMLPRS
jgi:hypothetical protein